ncbi:hypothetical protein [Enterobacter hormaechei]|uniref:hypothetical protein n=1 Tax=Enterobacter hormaechei TaxID=158836 RepID=UPI00384DB607
MNNKQARDKLKSAAAKAVDNFDPNMFVETRDVLALLDELEAAEQRIAELQIARDKCFLSGLKTGWEYGIANEVEGYNREIADAQAVVGRAAAAGKGE